jgi:hypothetical protein
MGNTNQFSKDYKSAKASRSVSKPKDVIYDPMGQWKYPGQVTKIPSGDITMQGVPYPVYGVDNLGNSQMMLPNMDYTFPGSNVTEYPMAQKGRAVSSLDSLRHQAGKMMDFEFTKGSEYGTGLTNYGNPALGINPSKEQAVDWYMANIAPKLNHFKSAMEKGEAGDFLYNTGKDARVYAYQEYLRRTDPQNKTGWKDASGNWKNRKALPQDFDQLYNTTIGKLPENERRIMVNRGRDWYYQNTAPAGSTWDLKTQGPHPAYYNTWKPRIWESVNTYAYGGDPSLPNITGHYPFGGQYTKTHTHMALGGNLPYAQTGKIVNTLLDAGKKFAYDIFNLNNVRKASGSIGNQGATPEGARDILNSIGIKVKAANPNNPTFKEMVEHLKTNPNDAAKFQDFLKKKPIEVIELPGGEYALKDGHHRATLSYYSGNENIPAVIKNKGEYTQSLQQKKEGGWLNKYDKKQEGGPHIIRSQDDSYYDPQADTIFLNKDEGDQSLIHEMYHRQQANEGRLRLPEYDPMGILRKAPALPEVAADYPYYNRRVVDENIITNQFLEQNPSFQFVNPDAVYNLYTNPTMYNTPWTAEGEAELSQTHGGREFLNEIGIAPNYLGEGFKKGGWLDKYQTRGEIQTMPASSTSTTVPQVAASKNFVFKRDQDLTKLGDTEFKEKYGTNKHTVKMNTNPSYRAKVMKDAKETAKQYGSINYPVEDVRSQNYIGNPNLAFMNPNAATGELARGIEDYNLGVIGTTLPIPGLQQVGKLPSITSALSTGVNALNKEAKNLFIASQLAKEFNAAKPFAAKAPIIRRVDPISRSTVGIKNDLYTSLGENNYNQLLQDLYSVYKPAYDLPLIQFKSSKPTTFLNRAFPVSEEEAMLFKEKFCPPGSACAKTANAVSSKMYTDITGLPFDINFNAHNAWHMEDQMMRHGAKDVTTKNLKIGDRILMGNNVDQSTYVPGYIADPSIRHAGTIAGVSKVDDELVPMVFESGRNNPMFLNPINYTFTGPNSAKKAFRPAQLIDDTFGISLVDKNIRYAYRDKPSVATYSSKNSEVQNILNSAEEYRETIKKTYDITNDEFDELLNSLIGIGAQETKLSGTLPGSKLSKAKIQLQNKLTEAGLTKPIKKGINLLRKGLNNIEVIPTSNLPAYPGASRIEMEAAILADKEGISLQNAIDQVKSNYQPKPKYTLLNAEPSKGPFRQKYQTELDRLSGFGSNLTSKNAIENALGQMAENYNKVKSIHTEASPRQLIDLTTLMWNSPGKAADKQLVDFYLRGINNPDPTRFKFDYINKVNQFRNDLLDLQLRGVDPHEEFFRGSYPEIQYKKGGWLSKYQEGGGAYIGSDGKVYLNPNSYLPGTLAGRPSKEEFIANPVKYQTFYQGDVPASTRYVDNTIPTPAPAPVVQQIEKPAEVKVIRKDLTKKVVTQPNTKVNQTKVGSTSVNKPVVVTQKKTVVSKAPTISTTVTQPDSKLNFKPTGLSKELYNFGKNKVDIDNKPANELVKNAANTVGVDPNLLFASAWQEGLNKAAQRPTTRSNAYFNHQLELSRDPNLTDEEFEDKVLNLENNYPVDGFYYYGLDTFGTMFPNLEKYLPKGFKNRFYSFDAKNEKGENIVAGAFKSHQDALIAKAAYLKYEQDNIINYAKKLGVNLDPDSLNYFTFASYNSGFTNAKKMLNDYAKTPNKENVIIKGLPGWQKIHKNIYPRMQSYQVAKQIKKLGGSIGWLSKYE